MDRALSLGYSRPVHDGLDSWDRRGAVFHFVHTVPAGPDRIRHPARGPHHRHHIQAEGEQRDRRSRPLRKRFPIEKCSGRTSSSSWAGSAPFRRSLLQYALDNRDQFGKIFLIYGAKRPGEMLFRKEFVSLMERDDLNCLLTVDKDDTGKWPGHTGLVTTMFRHVTDIDPEKTSVVVIGPPVMYKFVVAEVLKLNIPKHQILMSLERRMKCGVGKCGHCILGGYIYTCLEGPVFSYWDVVHMKGLI
jgi:NAD(P)H-flavin reductase